AAQLGGRTTSAKAPDRREPDITYRSLQMCVEDGNIAPRAFHFALVATRIFCDSNFFDARRRGAAVACSYGRELSHAHSDPDGSHSPDPFGARCFGAGANRHRQDGGVRPAAFA